MIAGDGGALLSPAERTGCISPAVIENKEEEQLSGDTNCEFVSLTYFLNILKLHLARVSFTSPSCVRSNQAVETLKTQDCESYCMYWAFILET